MRSSHTTLTTYKMESRRSKRVADQIKNELGDEVHILIHLIPSLADVVGTNEQALVEVGVMEARNRFNFAFRRFMRVVGSFGPLVCR